MSMIKSKAAHETCQLRIQEYLERDGRAIAHDFVNLHTADERRAWGHFMDKTRHAAGNDIDVSGPTVTYQHFMISPDPRDDVDIETLRALTMRWAHEFFGDWDEPGKLGSFEVAVVYHDDNARRIPHAHVIVNNTNLENGRRLHIDKIQSKELASRLQEISRDMGLRYFEEDDDAPQKSARYLTKTERALRRENRFVWKDDLAHNVDIARRTALSIEDFELTLRELGVGFHLNRAGDYVFGHPSNPKRWCASGYALGRSYTKAGVEAAIEQARLGRLPRAERMRENVVAHVMRDFYESMELVAVVERSESVDRVAQALRIQDECGFRSVADYEKRIAFLRRRAGKETGPARERDLERAAAIADALETVKAASFFDGVDLPGTAAKRKSASEPRRTRPVATHPAGSQQGTSGKRKSAQERQEARRSRPNGERPQGARGAAPRGR